MNYELLFKAIVAFAALLGIIATLRKTFLLSKKWRNDRSAKWSRFFGGNWDNQGQIKNRPSHYIDLEGWGGANQFEGRFNVRNSEDENSWEMFKICGKRRIKKLNCKIFRIHEDGEILIANGILKKTQNGLQWILGESSTDQFPKEALLRRGFPKIG
ncbi:MAG TPA: hypothetical protein VGQ09_15525 [Chitinophagaceae bacterium]|jgi:hypothetical protein|nr:hypothetical protein [Chitinophagaceae bacterium]